MEESPGQCVFRLPHIPAQVVQSPFLQPGYLYLGDTQDSGALLLGEPLLRPLSRDILSHFRKIAIHVYFPAFLEVPVPGLSTV